MRAADSDWPRLCRICVFQFYHAIFSGPSFGYWQRPASFELTFEQQHELFEIWLDHRRGGREARRMALPQRVDELSERGQPS